MTTKGEEEDRVIGKEFPLGSSRVRESWVRGISLLFLVSLRVGKKVRGWPREVSGDTMPQENVWPCCCCCCCCCSGAFLAWGFIRERERDGRRQGAV